MVAGTTLSTLGEPALSSWRLPPELAAWGVLLATARGARQQQPFVALVGGALRHGPHRHQLASGRWPLTDSSSSSCPLATLACLPCARVFLYAEWDRASAWSSPTIELKN